MAARLARDASCRATLLAVSGSRLADVERQASRSPADATHLIMSAGGNDILDLGRRLRSETGGMLQRIGRMSGMLGEFRQRYRAACKLVAARGRPAALCTIYEPPFGDPLLRQLGSAALHVVNAAIESEARACGLHVIDLRAICREPADFFDPIHPSSHGADKISAVLARWVQSTRV